MATVTYDTFRRIADQRPVRAARHLRGFEDLLSGNIGLTLDQLERSAQALAGLVDGLDAACRCRGCGEELGSRHAIRCAQCRRPTRSSGLHGIEGTDVGTRGATELPGRDVGAEPMETQPRRTTRGNGRGRAPGDCLSAEQATLRVDG